MNTTFNRLLFIIFVSVLAFLIALPKNFTISFDTPFAFHQEFSRKELRIGIGSATITRSLDLKLGLDLKGGTRLVFDVDTSSLTEANKESALESLQEVVSQRVNLFGVSEPTIQRANFEGQERLIIELPGVENTEEAIALVGKTAELMFFSVTDENDIVPTDLSGRDIKSAQVVFDTVSAEPVVAIEFSSEGAKKFERLTEENIGKPLPIVLDNQVVSSPVVNDKISGGSAQITGQFTLDEAKNLAIQINGGALPAPMSLVEQSTIGPSLGKTSIDKSIQAGILGVVLVGVFMILAYHGFGLIAIIGLILFTIYTLALYKLLPVVLTLPGIAGFLLSIGMAVDSNILIFERYREERALGASKHFAIERAFGRAWDSIRDANIATLVTAFILANPFNWSILHTSGPVRGFAVTLALGILVSLFTGVVVSRTLLRLIIRN